METSMASQHPLVILNPTANRGQVEQYRACIRQQLALVPGECVETRRMGEAEELAATAARAGRPLIVVGGDGTVHGVVNGILSTGTSVPLGIVAAGSGNDYAWRTLNLPRDPAAAVERAFYGQPVAVDVGQVNGRYFANSFSVGLDADIADAASRLKAYPLMSGERLYYLAAIERLLFGYQRCPWLRVCIDDEDCSIREVQEQRYVLLAITIGPAYGAGFRINPRAEYADGYFDVCAIDYLPLLKALWLFPTVKKGQHEGIAEVKFYRAKVVSLASRAPVRMEVDGEVSLASEFHVQLLPGGLSVRL